MFNGNLPFFFPSVMSHSINFYISIQTVMICGEGWGECWGGGSYFWVYVERLYGR